MKSVCCFCLSYTQAAWIVAIIELYIGVISWNGNEANMIYFWSQAYVFACALWDPSEPQKRKRMYFVYFGCSFVLMILSFIAFFVVVSVYGMEAMTKGICMESN